MTRALALLLLASCGPCAPPARAVTPPEAPCAVEAPACTAPGIVDELEAAWHWADVRGGPDEE